MTEQLLPTHIDLPDAALGLLAEVEDATHKPVHVVPNAGRLWAS